MKSSTLQRISTAAFVSFARLVFGTQAAFGAALTTLDDFALNAIAARCIVRVVTENDQAPGIESAVLIRVVTANRVGAPTVGTFITAYHVVKGAVKIRVEDLDGELVAAAARSVDFVDQYPPYE